MAFSGIYSAGMWASRNARAVPSAVCSIALENAHSFALKTPHVLRLRGDFNDVGSAGDAEFLYWYYRDARGDRVIRSLGYYRCAGVY